MEFNGHLEMKATDIILKKHGLQDMGPVQRYIDNECMKLMEPYTPMQSGFLFHDAPKLGTEIGSGEINYLGPYARYQYYGKLMVSSLTGSAWSHGESKVLTEKDLKYSKAQHPMAGPFWFDRMKADKKDDILKGAQEVANRNEHN